MATESPPGRRSRPVGNGPAEFVERALTDYDTATLLSFPGPRHEMDPHRAEQLALAIDHVPLAIG